MKIVHIITRFLRGGAEENTIASCLHQAESGNDVYLIFGEEYRKDIYDLYGDRLNLVLMEDLVHRISPKHDIKAYKKMTEFLKELAPDIVHTHQSKAGIIGRFAASAAKVPGIVHTVHIAPFLNVGGVTRAVYVVAEKAAAKVSDVVIDVSEGMKDACLDVGVGTPSQHVVIHSGMDLDRFAKAQPPEGWLEQIGWTGAERPFVALIMGSLEGRKRQAEFIQALAPLVRERRDFRLLLLGEGQQAAALADLIQREGLSGTVMLLGYSEEPERWLSVANLCVLTSFREGLPRVVMQAFAAGKPMVLTDLPGLSEVAKAERNALIYDMDDVAGAASAVAKLIDDKALLTRLTEGARETDVSKWGQERMCLRIDEAYKTAIARESRSN